MQTLGIVKQLNVFEHAQPRRFQISKAFVPGPFVLQRPVEAIQNRVVAAATCATHGTLDSDRLEDRVIRFARGLTAPLAISLLKNATRFQRLF
ncbi:MAG TPA: hypothetical protein VFE24_07125 [Pirellulales bacterium]|jgi:hypothetical protein|nr:hypothetical protein [Pirellulales bacterium]